MLQASVLELFQMSNGTGLRKEIPMNESQGKNSHFTRARAVITTLSGLSIVKVLLAVLANSRPHARPFALGLLMLLAPGSRVSYKYKIGDSKLIGFLRRKDIDSDLQSALELAIADRYRLNQIPRPDFIVDGGANTGLFSLDVATRWPGVPIVAFEPAPSNLEAIRSHLEANHLENFVRVEPVALAGVDGSKHFFLRDANQGSFSADLPADHAIEVQCRALAQYLPSDPETLKLIKLDIEGAEVEVLDALFANGGTKKTIIVLELHNTPVTRPWIEELARRVGFILEFYEIGSVTAHCQLTSSDL
jgi:FkbM family methyltransferase